MAIEWHSNAVRMPLYHQPHNQIVTTAATLNRLKSSRWLKKASKKEAVTRRHVTTSHLMKQINLLLEFEAEE